jgi:ABC-2 type transport system ATP-binding protein
MSIIDVKNLSKIYKVSLKKPGFKGTIKHFFNRSYRDIIAVKDVSFSIDSGEIVGFLGANGAGKTTTLKMLTGLIHPSTGEVKISGHIPFRRQAKFLKNMSLIMGQKQQLLWDLPALDSLKINAAVYEIPDKIFKAKTQGISRNVIY